MDVHVSAHLTKEFDRLLRPNASKCQLTSVCTFVTIIYNCNVRANFPTGRSARKRRKRLKRQTSYAISAVVCATAVAFLRKLYCKLELILRMKSTAFLHFPHPFHKEIHSLLFYIYHIHFTKKFIRCIQENTKSVKLYHWSSRCR